MTDSNDNKASVLALRFTKQSRPAMIAFGVAVLAMVLTAALVHQYKWIIKRPVPWPEGVQVNDRFRMTSMPRMFGAYRKLTPRDSFYAQLAKVNGDEDGRSGRDWADGVVPDEQMDALDMPSKGFDEVRYPARSSNWYAQRTYIDTRPDAMYRQWRLEIYYYTGLKDTVAHVPDICIQAGGGQGVSTGTIEFTCPGAPAPWNKPLDFLRTRSLRTYRDNVGNEHQIHDASYYIFVLNGKPVVASSLNEARWKVRNGLSSLSETYNYFAKIQFAPIGNDVDYAVSDVEAQQFINAALPAILPLLPTAADIQALEDAKAQSETKK